jgi:hypothetical protein
MVNYVFKANNTIVRAPKWVYKTGLQHLIFVVVEFPLKVKYVLQKKKITLCQYILHVSVVLTILRLLNKYMILELKIKCIEILNLLELTNFTSHNNLQH